MTGRLARNALLTIIVSDRGLQDRLRDWVGDANVPVSERMQGGDIKDLVAKFDSGFQISDPSIGTSRKVGHTDASFRDSCPGRSYGSETEESLSVATGPGAAELDSRQPQFGEEGKVPLYPPARLACPMHVLDCFESWSLVEEYAEYEWIEHSLTHFRQLQAPHKSISPHMDNECPFCPMKFSHLDGKTSWVNRMQHVAREHHQRGHSIATARPVFSLIQYLWQKQVITEAKYRDLLGPSVGRSSGSESATASTALATNTNGPTTSAPVPHPRSSYTMMLGGGRARGRHGRRG